ncbi:MAG: hypothetical protein IJV65_06820, partial [Kiritimatiellae bacterium]|nr:hypothetical protein [Kiritimatiellia bacterium]
MGGADREPAVVGRVAFDEQRRVRRELRRARPVDHPERAAAAAHRVRGVVLLLVADGDGALETVERIVDVGAGDAVVEEDAGARDLGVVLPREIGVAALVVALQLVVAVNVEDAQGLPGGNVPVSDGIPHVGADAAGLRAGGCVRQVRPVAAIDVEAAGHLDAEAGRRVAVAAADPELEGTADRGVARKAREAQEAGRAGRALERYRGGVLAGEAEVAAVVERTRVLADVERGHGDVRVDHELVLGHGRDGH